ncbi:outer membrane beta-barrel family protein [Larkinella humicola]|uniref:Outer membrane beta-barrel protein n=1 Tax=Larkinella humicola TaxID=2607654 RepID=A0A5N1JJ09_9BACT|nr:outer membrane beta-barrel family protein [Larkinella humicola]KAA9356430.1 outer membrane beta-barrel protein [Larkinella humicola]
MKSFFSILFLLIAFSALAQVTPKTIRGVVKDSQNETVPGATVSLLSASDSTLVQGEITNGNGKFELKSLATNRYILRVSSVGSNDYRSGPLTIDDQHPEVSLPVIILTPSKTMLNEVVVVAKRPLIEQEIDKTVVNVDAMISSIGSTTLEVLEKTPGVTVGTDGEISLNGKAGVLVLIDGRPTYLSGPDLASYLKSLPGGSLDKIELMTNPPAKYDAAGTSIINIRLKKNRVQGFVGDISASYSQGVTARTNNVINVNYNRKKINLFGSMGYSRDADYADDSYNRILYNENSFVNSSVVLQNNLMYTVPGVMTRLGMDYAISAKTTFGFVVNYQNRSRQERLDYFSKNFTARSVLDSLGKGYTNGHFNWRNVGVNGNFQHKFNLEGRELTADVNYITHLTTGEQRLTTMIRSADGSFTNRRDFLYNLPSEIAIYTAKADYVHPLKNKAVLEAGFKSSFVTTDNDSHYYAVSGNVQTPDYGKSNHFIYRETIQAAYLNSRKEWKRMAAQLGFRLENTLVNGRQLGNAEVKATTFDKNYTRLFPTAFFRYKLDSLGNNTLALSIARRINRPNYQLLNPFLFYRDAYSYISGNPLLKPQYHFQYELKYQHKNNFGIALQYNQFTDVIFQTTQAIDDIFITSPNNVASGRILAMATNLNQSLTKWWTLNANLTIAHMALNGVAYSEKLNPEIYQARMNLVNQLKFDKGWNGEVTGFYVTKDLNGQRITNPRYRINLAVQKKVLKDKGSVRLLAEDLFHSWNLKDRTVSLKQADAFHTQITDTRRIGVAFSYRFGKETFARKRRHNDNAADAEKGRVD